MQCSIFVCIEFAKCVSLPGDGVLYFFSKNLVVETEQTHSALLLQRGESTEIEV